MELVSGHTASVSTATASARNRPSFPSHSSLRTELNRRVDEYFRQSGKARDGGAGMLVKSAIILGWAVSSYALLMFWSESWWSAAPLAASLGLALACIGFSIQHDGNHGAYSKRPLISKLATGTLDLIGGSSFIWRQKHNVLHHTYTNVDGIDDDIVAWPFLLLAPSQRRLWFHRWQHLYFPVLMGLFFVSKWAIWDDFYVAARGRIGSQRIPRPRGRDLVQMLLGKAFYFGWAFVLPLLVHSVIEFLAVYLLVTFIQGVTLGVVFQLAHAVEEAAFVPVPADGGAVERPWFEHQLATTMNFATDNRVISWYVGGLNFQVEHHLFPRISHRHYPALAPIVREVCREHGVPYLSQPTMRRALVSHLRFLKDIGAGQHSQPSPAAARAPVYGAASSAQGA